MAGCSTGEEAYSLAIVLKEAMERNQVDHGVQIFATDLDPEAIEVARAGRLSREHRRRRQPERLERFFTREEEGFYRIKKEIREMLVFAPHNLIEDPPFTKLDLLSCRNLLIYLEGRAAEAADAAVPLQPAAGRVLFLGSSETMGGFGDLFDTLDKNWKTVPAPGGRRRAATSATGRWPRCDCAGARIDRRRALAARGWSWGWSHSAERALMQHLVPPSIIMHERGDIVHIHGRTGLFLEPAPGAQSSSNVYNMAREGLQLDLAVAVRHAAASEQADRPPGRPGEDQRPPGLGGPEGQAADPAREPERPVPGGVRPHRAGARAPRPEPLAPGDRRLPPGHG